MVKCSNDRENLTTVCPYRTPMMSWPSWPTTGPSRQTWRSLLSRVTAERYTVEKCCYEVLTQFWFLQDYVFHLLTGYQEPPAGKVLEEGQAYNPYFPGGGVLSMAQQLFDEMLEYPDGRKNDC